MITAGDSSNLVKIADNLKGLTDNALEREKQNPHGFAPAYMIVSEQGRRKKLRDKYPGDPQTTVAQDLSMATQAYQGQDVLTGIMAGGQPPMMQQPQMAAEGGLMGYNEGGIIGYANGTQPGAVPEEEEEERMSGLARLLQGPEGARERYEENQARIRERQKLANEGFGQGFFAGLFKNETDAEYQARIAKNKERDQALADTYKIPGKSKKDAKEAVVDKTKKSTDTGTGTGTGTGKSTGIKGGQPKGGQPIPPPNPFAELLKQEYEMSKKAYTDAQNQRDMSKQLGLMGFGLNLAQTGSLAKAGIAGLDQFKGEKDKQRKILSGLAKDRSASAKTYASGMLDVEKLGLDRRKLAQTAKFNAEKIKTEWAKANSTSDKNEVLGAAEILENARTDGKFITYAEAVKQYRNTAGRRTKPIGRDETRNLSLGIA